MKFNYIKPLAIAAFLLFCARPLVSLATSDTVTVRTFSFTTPRDKGGNMKDSTFIFPKPDQYRKVLMYYTLKCNPKLSPACGQWDYLTYTYLYQHTGIMDSTRKIDSTYDAIKKIYVKDTTWPKHERLTQYEIGRFITLYGIGVSLGNGFTWTYDVTDYLPLLHDSVHLSAGNWQELLDLKFVFIKGTPARQPLKVVNVWNGNFNYGSTPEFTDILGQKNIKIDSNAASTKMVIRVSGHGEDGSNCAEFCAKTHWLNVDNTMRWSQLVWRDNCAYNPLFHQGGTWPLQRANWCPGAEVQSYNAELTPWVTPGKNSLLQYDADPYTTTTSSSGNSNPYYALETQLIYYGPNNFKLNAAVDNILSPTTDNMFGHSNPVCANPRIIIKNNGTTTLTSLTITFGTTGGPQSTHHWTGSLAYLETDTVDLEQFDWVRGGGPFIFQAKVSAPNGGTDEYANDDIMYSNIPVTQKLANTFIIATKTNAVGSDNAYTVTNVDGKVIYHRENMQNNTLYRDTITLNNGCYQFRFTDDSQDGLYFFANPNAGTGSLKFLTATGSLIKNFEPDFGAEVLMNFNVGYGLAIKPDVNKEYIDVFPNPSNGIINIDAISLEQKPFTIDIYNMVGKLIYSQASKPGDDPVVKIDMNGKPAGVYIVNLSTGDKVFTSKVVLER